MIRCASCKYCVHFYCDDDDDDMGTDYGPNWLCFDCRCRETKLKEFKRKLVNALYNKAKKEIVKMNAELDRKDMLRYKRTVTQAMKWRMFYIFNTYIYSFSFSLFDAHNY